MIKQMFIKLDNSVLELVEKLQVSMKTPSLDSQWIPARLPRYVKGDVKRLGFLCLLSFIFVKSIREASLVEKAIHWFSVLLSFITVTAV